jgi:uncharacterized protein
LGDPLQDNFLIAFENGGSVQCFPPVAYPLNFTSQLLLLLQSQRAGCSQINNESARSDCLLNLEHPEFGSTAGANPGSAPQFTKRLVAAAIERTRHSVRYVSAYVRIPYPNGDVPADTGVCTDEIIRSYRALGVDLQKEVHEDMLRNFAAYPNQKRWRLDHADSNIDRRRVPNLMIFFQRKGETLPLTNRAADDAPGDLVTWDLGGGLPHIGIVVDQKANWSGGYMVVHNIGAGPKMEDVLFHWKITGHYRYFGPGGSQSLGA